MARLSSGPGFDVAGNPTSFSNSKQNDMTIDSSRIDQARELFEAGDYAAAEAIFREALQENPDHPQILMMVGLCVRGRGRVEEGVALLKQAAGAGGDDCEVHVHLARARLDQGDVEGARESLKNCLTISPNHLQARTLLGQIELHSGRPRAAAESLQTALRVDPDHAPALAGLAMALLESGRASEARSYAEKAVRNDPKNITAQIAMAQVFQALGHASFAEQCLRNALELQPNSAEIWAALGGIQARNGQHADAAHALNQAVRYGSRTDMTLLGLASSLHKLGRLDDARRIIEQFIADMPDHPGARAKLAEIHLDREQPEQARPILANLEHEQAASITLLRARLAEASGELDQAHALAAELHRHDNNEIADKARMLTARVARARGSAVVARKALDPLIKAGRREPQASWMLADIVAESGQLDRAREILERLIDKDTQITAATRARTARRLALMLDRAGQYEQAGQFLEQPGWESCDYLPRILKDSPAPLYEAYQAIDTLHWDDLSVDDGRPQPVFILGWPGSGRDLLLSALEGQPAVTMMERTTGQRRREALGVPINPAQLTDVDEGRLRIGRKRFLGELRGVQVGAAVVDPSWWEAASVAALGRFFPGARVILPRAEPAAQELYWLMAGYRNIEQMLAAKNEDDELLNHLKPMLPLNFIEVELEDLLDQPGQELDRLARSLGIEFDAQTSRKLMAGAEETPYVNARHWHHYSSRLSSGVSLFDEF